MNTPDTAHVETQRQLSAIAVRLEHLTDSSKKVAIAIDKLTAIEAQNQARDAKLLDHETRLRALEVNAWKIAGALRIVAFAGPAVAKALGIL
jgi:hypothetical protein